MNMFVVSSYSQLEEALLLQVQEVLLCGAIGEQVHAYYGSTNFDGKLTPVYRKTINSARRHYDIVDFRGKGKLARLLLSRRMG